MSKPQRAPMNAWQKAVANNYCHGDFAHFRRDPNWRANLDGCGDSLFRFLMIELSTQEDCDSAEEAINRLENAREDIDSAIRNVIAATGGTMATTVN